MQKAALEINKENRKKRIIEAAISVITRDNSINMNLEDVVALARTSKSAVYDLFKNKEGLLAAVCEHVLFKSHVLTSVKLTEESSLRDDMIKHVDTFLNLSHTEEYVAVMRVVYAMIPKSKVIAEKYFSQGIEMAISNVAKYFDNRVAEGRLRIEDTYIAAKQLLGALVWFEQSQILSHGKISLSQEQMHADALCLIDNFLSAHAV